MRTNIRFFPIFGIAVNIKDRPRFIPPIVLQGKRPKTFYYYMNNTTSRTINI